MLEHVREISLLVFLLGFIITGSLGIKAALQRLSIPPLLGYLVLGGLLGHLEREFLPLPENTPMILEFLGQIGIICLLFRVGLEANLQVLIQQLRGSCLIWLSDVAISGLIGFSVARWLAGLDLIPSLIVAVALTATSVGIPVEIWRSRKLLNTPQGQRFLEVAELDDISAVVLMAMLASILPKFASGEDVRILPELAIILPVFVVKFALFGGLCFVFAHYGERRVTSFFQKPDSPPEPILAVVGIGFMIAAIAGLLGFSVAVGAFFAGLAFSRDPEAVKLDASFGTLYELFTPFFFFHIGYLIPLNSLGQGTMVGLILLLAAVSGKLLATVPQTWRKDGPRNAWALGVSMIPRSEIALLVLQSGLLLGAWAVPPEVFSGMALVSVITSIGAPLILNAILSKAPSPSGQGAD